MHTIIPNCLTFYVCTYFLTFVQNIPISVPHQQKHVLKLRQKITKFIVYVVNYFLDNYLEDWVGNSLPIESNKRDFEKTAAAADLEALLGLHLNSAVDLGLVDISMFPFLHHLESCTIDRLKPHIQDRYSGCTFDFVQQKQD